VDGELVDPRHADRAAFELLVIRDPYSIAIGLAVVLQVAYLRQFSRGAWFIVGTRRARAARQPCQKPTPASQPAATRGARRQAHEREHGDV
jgi:hypothetical protein